MSSSIELKGEIRSIVYQSPDQNYTVARVIPSDTENIITIVGCIPFIRVGEILQIKGTWTKHKTFGDQLQVQTYASVPPDRNNIQAIESYLGSGMIKGIGPAIASRIIAKFGKDSLDILDNDPMRLKEVKGIGDKSMKLILGSYETDKECRAIMLYMGGYGISPSVSLKVYKVYGATTKDVLETNPYVLADDVFGIGFKKADDIADTLGFDRLSPLRINAGVKYYLTYICTSEGHVCYELSKLTNKVCEELDISEDLVNKSVRELETNKDIVLKCFSETDWAYPSYFNFCEEALAKLSVSRVSMGKNHIPDIEERIKRTEAARNITYSEGQKTAIRNSLEDTMHIITGGPGVGKTTIISAVIDIARSMGKTILQAAPTGRAAKKMEEATGFPSKTIHRLLEFTPGGSMFKRNSYTPFTRDEVDIMIIDESSMLDLSLAYNLMSAIDKNVSVILVGDIDQLPSVGPGNVLRDLINSKLIGCSRLNEIYRQKEHSAIVVAAHDINSGKIPETGDGFSFIESEDPAKAADIIVNLISNILPSTSKYDPMLDIQVLTPMHKGPLGTIELNRKIQDALNKNTNQLVHGRHVFKPGDKVMQTVNDYDNDIFNGDMGIVSSIDIENKTMEVDYDDKEVLYDFSNINDVVLSYAVTIHKSQGSEYPVVIIPVHSQHYIMLYRNLIYTGITRGKVKVILVGTRKSLAIAVHNDRQTKRNTFLKERMRTAGIQ